MIGSVQIRVETGATAATGECRLGTTSGPIAGTAVGFPLQNDPDSNLSAREMMSTSGVTPVLPAGQHSFGLDCGDLTGSAIFDDAKVTVVALSDQ